MNPFDPFNVIHLSGMGTMRYVTLALPRDSVRNLLPNGLELGPQTMTPPGTHPVLLGFHEMFRLHASIPSLLPSMTYHEHSVGIPYCFVTQNQITPRTPGPYYFMPILLLDNVWAALGGLLFWGYAKQLAAFSVDQRRFSISRIGGEPVLSTSYESVGDARPIAHYPHFELQRQAISQPLISMVPLSVGPFFVVAGFPKKWDVATLRPLETVTEVFTDYVVGLSSGRYPSTGRSQGIDASVMGAYELRAPFQVGSPYPPIPR
jgi:hypothetical protein